MTRFLILLSFFLFSFLFSLRAERANLELKTYQREARFDRVREEAHG